VASPISCPLAWRFSLGQFRDQIGNLVGVSSKTVEAATRVLKKGM
jgi:hypothetical protein